ETGTNAYLRVNFINTGILPFSHISYTVSHHSGDIEAESATPLINPREKGSFFIRLPLDGVCESQLATVSVSAIENETLTTFPTGKVSLAVAETPFLQRNVLLEDFSNESCNNCPDAAIAIEKTIDSLEEPFRINLVTHHAGSSYDFFTIDASKEYECFYTNSKYSPMALFDRTYVNGEINIVPSTEAIVKPFINTELSREAEASLSFIPYIDLEKGLVEVNTHGIICENRPVNLTLFITENNVSPIHQSGASKDYIHNAVLRSTGLVWGTPVETDANGAFSLSARADFNNAWKREDCRVIAFLTDNDPTSPTYRAVLQSVSLPLAYAEETTIDNANIDEIENGGTDIAISIDNGHLVISGDYTSANVFRADGIEISADHIPTGILIVKVTLPDGNILTKKIINI
ncbi:MAG: Omp28-related outer membrane protein, partial [Muribaculaceae bacterium]|nr:Omp28-related outer membrane protein [Muribaculaceae bacterium]